MNFDKAMFVAHLFWVDFMYRARLDPSAGLPKAREVLWANWLMGIDTKHAEMQKGSDATTMLVFASLLGELYENEHAYYETFVARCDGKENWLHRWAKLLLLAIKSDLVDPVGKQISMSGRQKSEQESVQMFLWSTRGL